LFSLATEQEKLDVIWNEVKIIRDTIKENADFVSLLCHPEMTQEKRIAVIERIFKERLSDDSMGFLHVLIQKGRIGEILSILDYFDEKAKEFMRIGVVKVSTPMPLDDSLLGGIVIRIGDRVLDNSIRTKMDILSRQLYKVKL